MKRRQHTEQDSKPRRSTWIDPDYLGERLSETLTRSRYSKEVGAAPPPAPRPFAPIAPLSEGAAGGGTGPIRRRPRLRSFLFGSSALASVAALVAGTVFPATTAATADGSVSAYRQQAFVADEASDVPATLDDISVSMTSIAVPEVGMNGGSLSVGGLTDTKLQYPFAQEVPLTDGFGYRSAPVAGFHDAQDMGAAGGTPIRIVGDGVITEAGWASDGCGFSLQVQHQVAGQNVVSRYCHMQENSHSWQVGQTVKGGDQAGLVGTTGMSFGNHLHLVMRVEDEPVDPLPLIAANSQ